MSSRPIVRVSGLGKRYQLGELETFDSLRDAIPAATRRLLGLGRRSGGNGETGRESKEFWALKDVSFDVQEGEVLGIIGRNGAGKSTLLKILSRITEPTEGEVRIRGRVSSLLEVGTGFHPDLTGRENVYLNGTILGMTKREIDRKFDEIVDFSGVEKFLDTPVKRYSSGMSVRLAFAVAAHLEPDILIIDEVLAVGDAEFQRKCMGKVQDVAGEGRTVLFVSHNIAAVRSLTSRAVLLSNGHLQFIGGTEDAIASYVQQSLSDLPQMELNLDRHRRGRADNSPVKIARVAVIGANGSSLPRIHCGDPVRITLEIRSDIEVATSCVSLQLTNERGETVAVFFSLDSAMTFPIRRGVNYRSCVIRDLPLSPGRYLVTTGINTNATAKALDAIFEYPLFEVELPGIEDGRISWKDRPWGAVHWQKVEWHETRAVAATERT